MAKGLYSIESFIVKPSPKRGEPGPSITLSGEVARDIFRLKRDERSPLFALLETTLRESVHNSDRPYVRIEYVDDTWLLACMHAGSSCACFGISDSVRNGVRNGQTRDIRYSSHNVDTVLQGAAILSTWLFWFNHVLSQTGHEQPFAM
jgi:hypothetical protein